MKLVKIVFALLLLCPILPPSSRAAFVQQIDSSDSYKRYELLISSGLSDIEKEKRIESILKEVWEDLDILAKCHYEFGKYLFTHQLGDPLRHFRQAVALYDSIGDTTRIRPCLNNLGFVNFRRGNFSATLKSYRRLTLEGETDRFTVRAHHGMGDCYEKLGDYHLALYHYENAAKKADKINLPSQLYLAYMQLSRIYALMDRKAYHKQILDYLEKIDSIGQHTGIPPAHQYVINDRRANLFDALGDYQKAIYYHMKALKSAKSIDDASVKYSGNNNLAISFLKTENWPKSKSLLDRALSYASGPDQFGTVYNNLGDYYLKIGAFDNALTCYRKSILLFSGMNDSTPYQNPTEEILTITPYKVKLIKAIEDKADYWWEMYLQEKDVKYQHKALADLQVADKILEILRYKSVEEQSKLFWRQKASSIYAKAVRICYHLNDVEQAFYFMEKNKAILLLEDITNAQARTNSGLPLELQEIDLKLRQAVTHAEMETFLSHGKTRALLDSTRHSYFEFETELKKDFPLYGAYKEKLNLVSLSEMDALTKNSETLILHYLLSETEGYGLFFSKGKEGIFALSDLPDLLLDVQKLNALCIKPFISAKDQSDYTHLAYGIYDRVIPPEARLGGQKLLISPDYTLQRVAFEALTSSPFPDSLATSFLVNQSEISYVYSFSHLLANQEMDRKGTQGMAAFTPLSFPGTSLPDLPESYYEIDQKRTTNHFSGSLSSKSKFIESLNKYQAIHLATHANFDGPPWPWVSFHDSLMYLPEIYASTTNAELIVLSACGTAQGEMKNGEGIMSLARGFFHSGANSIISTLWNVNDGSSSRILAGFYQYLSRDFSKSKSLQLAKIDYLRSSTGSAISPCYWSPFVLIGSDRPLNLKSQDYTWLLLCGILLFALLLAIPLRRKFR